MFPRKSRNWLDDWTAKHPCMQEMQAFPQGVQWLAELRACAGAGLDRNRSLWFQRISRDYIRIYRDACSTNMQSNLDLRDKYCLHAVNDIRVCSERALFLLKRKVFRPGDFTRLTERIREKLEDIQLADLYYLSRFGITARTVHWAIDMRSRHCDACPGRNISDNFCPCEISRGEDSNTEDDFTHISTMDSDLIDPTQYNQRETRIGLLRLLAARFWRTQAPNGRGPKTNRAKQDLVDGLCRAYEFSTGTLADRKSKKFLQLATSYLDINGINTHDLEYRVKRYSERYPDERNSPASTCSISSWRRTSSPCPPSPASPQAGRYCQGRAPRCR